MVSPSLCLAFLLLSCGPKYTPPPVGQAVELRFTAVDGRKVDLAALKGKVVLIDFWATWCEPCLVELPRLKALYEKLHPQGFEIVGISSDNEAAKVLEFTRDRHLPWPQYCDAKGTTNAVNARFGIEGLPTLWLIDKEGKMSDSNPGDQLAEKVEKLLAQ